MLRRRALLLRPMCQNLVAVAPSPIVVGSDDGAIATLPVSEIAAQPSGSSTTLIPVDDSEVAPESVPPPPSKRGIVLGLRAPSATPTYCFTERSLEALRYSRRSQEEKECQECGDGAFVVRSVRLRSDSAASCQGLFQEPLLSR